MRLSVPLAFKFPDPDEIRCVPQHTRKIDYVVRPIASQQPITRGRLLLQPDLDLADYTVTAVLDWLEVGFVTEGRHQAQNIATKLNDHLAAAGHRGDCQLRGVERKWGHVGHCFLLRINDATPAKVALACRHLAAHYQLRVLGCGAPLVVTGVEVAVDLYPDHARLEPEEATLARWRMSDILSRHIRVHPRLVTTDDDLPRFKDEEGSPVRKLVITSQPPPVRAQRLLGPAAFKLPGAALTLGNHRQPTVDSTFYVGAEASPLMLRLQDKTADSHERRHGQKGRTPLPAERRRSRIEVRAMLTDLTEERLAACRGLAELGHADPQWACKITTLSDLQSANFEALRRGFFDFVLPTVPASDGDEGNAPDKAQWNVFARSGAYGLDLYQSAQHQVALVERLRTPEGCKGRSPRLGSKGHNRAYFELHERVRKALDRLSRQWRRFEVP